MAMQIEELSEKLQILADGINCARNGSSAEDTLYAKQAKDAFLGADTHDQENPDYGEEVAAALRIIRIKLIADHLDLLGKASPALERYYQQYLRYIHPELNAGHFDDFEDNPFEIVRTILERKALLEDIEKRFPQTMTLDTINKVERFLMDAPLIEKRA